ncbi:glycerophosphodiester phosphodiesterase family protein [uncultured Clostridium sp.]|uniref:glycerophosphodiester phosphodiesterase family protein n=1 Tax=uncultured Clostridium sp. TaxID=59620 RepID=UPI0026219939|nr:glycerophosphodiester phosphodiesterase family protein [uncultured Clostridium sp.]
MRKRNLGIILGSIIILGGIVISGSDKVVASSYEKNDKNIIAHCLGSVDGKIHTNSKEAFEEFYSKGVRNFEVDLIKTADGHLVARHDWMEYLYETLEQPILSRNNTAPLLEDFKNTKINKKYTPLDFNDLLDLLIKYPEANIILDTKVEDKESITEIFTLIENQMKEKGVNSKQIIPQIYNREMLAYINDIYKFENVYYTLYLDKVKEQEVLDFAKENDNVKAIVMPTYKYNKSFIKNLSENGINSYVHTINKMNEAKKFLDNGVTGIYSDEITEIK